MASPETPGPRPGTMEHRTLAELEAGLADLLASPRMCGTLRQIVCRPATDARQMLPRAELSVTDGLVGDDWRMRGSRSTSDGAADPRAQLTLMNARAAGLVAGSEDRWALAGDQLYVDFDLSAEHLPAGTRLAIGGAIVEVTALPHTGCRKFAARFGSAALQFVNSPRGKQLRLRGVNARVVQAGTVHVGDSVRVLPPVPAT